jgi:hypothetical protein
LGRPTQARHSFSRSRLCTTFAQAATMYSTIMSVLWVARGA